MKKTLRIITNKYIIATLVFAVVIIFIDEYSLRVSSRLSRQVDALHREETELLAAIEADSIAASEISESLDAKEHYGRENYYMKRPNEDIFVIK